VDLDTLFHEIEKKKKEERKREEQKKKLTVRSKRAMEDHVGGPAKKKATQINRK